MQIDILPSYVQDFIVNMRSVVLFPLDPDSRIYFLYLLTSMVFAYFVYRRLRKAQSDEATTFLGFLFPRRIWSHPSAWLDVRYFFFHRMTGAFLASACGVLVTASVFMLLTGLERMPKASETTVLTGWQGLGASISFMIVALLVADFTAFFVHYLLHKIPVLWQFHKVHHSAEVMHPLSNYREHPIDNLLFSLTSGVTYGAVLAFAANVFGYRPPAVSFLGVPVINFVFNLAGSNLRHSHVWLRWPGLWAKLFSSPAHHQVHHSCHPEHLDKNFALMLPIWDVLFGTYEMPEDNRNVRFGVTEKDGGKELNSCLRLYFVPFRDAWRLMTRSQRKEVAPAPAETERAEGELTDPSTAKG